VRCEQTIADYGNCITGIPNSILKYFGVPIKNASLPALDALMVRGGFKHIVLLLFDSMGLENLNHHLSPDCYLRTHLLTEVSSVFPPTTVAATTSVMTGLTPAEHGWLGWSTYFSEIDRTVLTFSGKDTQDGAPAPAFHPSYRFLPRENLDSILNRSGKARGRNIFNFPLDKKGYVTERDMIRKVKKAASGIKPRFVYCYNPQPDSLMHEHGPVSAQVCAKLWELDDAAFRLSKTLRNTLLIITADHGHIDCSGVCILDYPELVETLERLPSMEPRAMNCFVKKGRGDAFQAAARSAFGERVLILPKAEVIARGIFGPARQPAVLQKRLGDFLVLPKGNLAVFNSYGALEKTRGLHAGITQTELRVPVIAEIIG
jgi:hypothetical protein